MLKNVAVCSCCIALTISGVLAWIAINDTNWGNEEYNTYIVGNSFTNRETQIEVADYINQNCSDGVLLLDSNNTWYIILRLDTTYNVITTCSYTFEEAIKDPWQYNVKYIVVADPDSLQSDDINTYYPDLYENGADWCTVIFETDDYHLYEVIY